MVGIQKINQKQNGPLSVQIACKSASDLRETVYQEIKQTDWVLIEFHQETKTLETIFRELTEED